MKHAPPPHLHTWKLWDRGESRVASPGPVSCSSGSGLGMTPKMVPVTISNATLMTAIRAVVPLGISVTVRSEPWGGAYCLSVEFGPTQRTSGYPSLAHRGPRLNGIKHIQTGCSLLTPITSFKVPFISSRSRPPQCHSHWVWVAHLKGKSTREPYVYSVFIWKLEMRSPHSQHPRTSFMPTDAVWGVLPRPQKALPSFT